VAPKALDRPLEPKLADQHHAGGLLSAGEVGVEFDDDRVAQQIGVHLELPHQDFGEVRGDLGLCQIKLVAEHHLRVSPGVAAAADALQHSHVCVR
jgi:hypothetical protein